MARVTKLEKERRIYTMMGWIINGVQDYRILKQAVKQWDISNRQAKKYLKTARENWKRDEDEDIQLKRDNKIAELQEIKRSLKEKYKGTPAGIRAVMMVEKEIIKIEALITRKVDITSKGDKIIPTREERDEYLKKIQDKVMKDADN